MHLYAPTHTHCNLINACGGGGGGRCSFGANHFYVLDNIASSKLRRCLQVIEERVCNFVRYERVWRFVLMRFEAYVFIKIDVFVNYNVLLCMHIDIVKIQRTRTLVRLSSVRSKRFGAS